MLRKIGWLIITLGIISIAFSLYYNETLSKAQAILTAVISMTVIPLGAGLIFINAKAKSRNRARIIYLTIALIIIALSIFLRYYHRSGAGVTLVIGVLWFCFAYSPIQLKTTYLKWVPYSKSKYESMLLSSLDFIGISSLFMGYMFKVQRWPYADMLMQIVIITILIGLFLWNFKFKHEIVRRKEAEDKIQEQYKEIQDSINYAKRIQYTLLANDDLLKNNLPEHFILFKPKDIVSGDFYWATKKDNDFYLAVCDCTGHGVPGAFMSLLNISFLNEAIVEKNIQEPNKILNFVRDRLLKNLDGGQDGMDAILVRISGNKIHYAAAHNKPLLITNNKLIELSADKMPVGKGEKKDSFSMHELELQKGDILYLYTDGYADQFGGEKGKKFKYANLQKILLENNKKSCEDIKKTLTDTYENWKGSLEQIDDVTVIGLRV